MDDVKINFKRSFYLNFGKIVSQLITGLIFFFIITPIAILIRLIRKDFLNLKFNKKKSYWIEKNEPKGKMKNQF